MEWGKQISKKKNWDFFGPKEKRRVASRPCAIIPSAFSGRRSGAAYQIGTLTHPIPFCFSFFSPMFISTILRFLHHLHSILRLLSRPRSAHTIPNNACLQLCWDSWSSDVAGCMRCASSRPCIVAFGALDSFPKALKAGRRPG